jgi:hypothetical protein
MKKNFLEIGVIIIAIVLGIIIGKYSFSEKIITTQKIVMSERKDACEAKGGRYNYLYNSYSGEYYEDCQIDAVNIKEF